MLDHQSANDPKPEHWYGYVSDLGSASFRLCVINKPDEIHWVGAEGLGHSHTLEVMGSIESFMSSSSGAGVLHYTQMFSWYNKTKTHIPLDTDVVWELGQDPYLACYIVVA